MQAFLSVLNILQNLCHFTQMAYYNGKIHYAEHIDTDVNGENTLWERPIDPIYYTHVRARAHSLFRGHAPRYVYQNHVLVVSTRGCSALPKN